MKRAKTPWYTAQRRAQEAWKARSPTLPEDARGPGTTFVESRGEVIEVGPFPVCLPRQHAARNLLPDVRDEALRRFAAHGITWHGVTPGPGGAGPSTHLLDSQVQCVNTLLSCARTRALLELVQQAVPTATGLVPVEDGHTVAFEWIGDADYLEERPGEVRHRGRYTTSLDALAVAETPGGRTLVGIEWKFTESYAHGLPRRLHALRHRRYGRRFEAAPFAEHPPLEAFFHDPHDQLMRQALLLHAMCRANEFGGRRAVLVHVVPGDNRHLRNTVTPGLAPFGDRLHTVWGRLLPGPELRYVCVDSATLWSEVRALQERYG